MSEIQSELSQGKSTTLEPKTSTKWNPQISKVWKNGSQKPWKSSPDSPNSSPKGAKGGAGRPLEPSCGDFENQAGSKFGLGGLLGGVWEASWAVLMRNWGPRWFQVGSQKGGFWSPKTKRKWMRYWEPLGVDIFMDFGSILGSKMKPSWHQIEVQHR